MIKNIIYDKDFTIIDSKLYRNMGSSIYTIRKSIRNKNRKLLKEIKAAKNIGLLHLRLYKYRNKNDKVLNLFIGPTFLLKDIKSILYNQSNEIYKMDEARKINLKMSELGKIYKNSEGEINYYGRKIR